MVSSASSDSQLGHDGLARQISTSHLPIGHHFLSVEWAPSSADFVLSHGEDELPKQYSSTSASISSPLRGRNLGINY
jgi:hypothetical protein